MGKTCPTRVLREQQAAFQPMAVASTMPEQNHVFYFHSLTREGQIFSRGSSRVLDGSGLGFSTK